MLGRRSCPCPLRVGCDLGAAVADGGLIRVRNLMGSIRAFLMSIGAICPGTPRSRQQPNGGGLEDAARLDARLHDSSPPGLFRLSNASLHASARRPCCASPWVACPIHIADRPIGQ